MLEEELECLPISNLNQLWHYQIPSWAQHSVALKHDNRWCIAGKDIKCHEDLEDWRPQTHYDRGTVPRTLVCHDMQGGYLEDRFVNGSVEDTSYNFYHWSLIDIFVYFSHHLITIPPLGWINAAHKHGVKILGTIITEWDDGEKILNEIISSKKLIDNFVDAIVNITHNLKIDGWLLNIEHKVDDIESLKCLVARLAFKLHRANPKSLLIWYDSVIETGELKWQNELNANNRIWFDICDAFFTNYTWKESNLERTMKEAKHRNLDVYVGVDVFGRNCVGGMDSNKSLELIRSYGLSLALFAPGWTYETLVKDPPETFSKRFNLHDLTFWQSLLPYLYSHGPTESFVTIFDKGSSLGRFNLNEQFLPINYVVLGCEIQNESDKCKCLILSDQISAIPFTSPLKITNCNVDETNIHKLIACNISCQNNFYISFILQSHVEHFEFLLLIQKINNRFTKVVLSDKNANSSDLSEYSAIKLDRLPSNMQEAHSHFENVSSPWKVQCFKVETPYARLLEINVTMQRPGEILLGGISVMCD